MAALSTTFRTISGALFAPSLVRVPTSVTTDGTYMVYDYTLNVARATTR